MLFESVFATFVVSPLYVIPCVFCCKSAMLFSSAVALFCNVVIWDCNGDLIFDIVHAVVGTFELLSFDAGAGLTTKSLVNVHVALID